MRMIKEHAINPFDTQLGCREPLTLERAFLVNFLSVLGTPVGETRPHSDLTDVSGMEIDELYQRYSDMSRGGSPRTYVACERVEERREGKRVVGRCISRGCREH